MHPNLSKTRLSHDNEPHSSMTFAQALMLIGTWAGFFAVGYALLP